jgi:3-deoxy-D-manno-octulosonate 8-phosphate phosphatase (KDO 8-P phosphatase)
VARSIPEDVARRIKLVIVDIDGVCTDGGIMMGVTDSGETVELKRFEITDGLGLKLMKWAGLHVYLVSGRRSRANSARAADLHIPYQEADGGYKLPVVEKLVEQLGVTWDEVCCIGDDLPDMALMRRAGLPVAVRNAVREVKQLAKWETGRAGGDGAVRELADALLKARGQHEAVLAEYEKKRSKPRVTEQQT